VAIFDLCTFADSFTKSTPKSTNGQKPAKKSLNPAESAQLRLGKATGEKTNKQSKRPPLRPSQGTQKNAGKYAASRLRTNARFRDESSLLMGGYSKS
jgi:hypothetical protein